MDKIMKKRIEEAAMRNATCRFYDDDDEILDISVKSFEDGARWRIDSAWHDGTASCEARRKALVLFDNGSAKVYEDLRELSVERLWGYVDRFAYLDDLLPDGGREAKND